MISARKCVIQSAEEKMAFATGLAMQFVLRRSEYIASSDSVIHSVKFGNIEKWFANPPQKPVSLHHIYCNVFIDISFLLYADLSLYKWKPRVYINFVRFEIKNFISSTSNNIWRHKWRHTCSKKVKRYGNEIYISTSFLTLSTVIFCRQDWFLYPRLLFTCGNAMLLVLPNIN